MVAWRRETYSAVPVDLRPVASLFPQTGLDSGCLVHLFPRTGNCSDAAATVICLKLAGPPPLTVCSWAGLDCGIDTKERTLYFETFIRFVAAFRALNNLKLRILIGGLFNVDLKVIQVGRSTRRTSKIYLCSGSSGNSLKCRHFSTPTDQTRTRGES